MLNTLETVSVSFGGSCPNNTTVLQCRSHVSVVGDTHGSRVGIVATLSDEVLISEREEHLDSRDDEKSRGDC